MALHVRVTHPGRSGYVFLPSDWGSRLAAAAAQGMAALCEIRAPSTYTVADEGTGERTETLGALLYSGKCRVQRLLRRGNEAASSERAVLEADYLVAIVLAANATPVGSRAKITQVADTLLQGQTLAVADVVMGSMRFQRDLYCTLT